MLLLFYWFSPWQIPKSWVGGVRILTVLFSGYLVPTSVLGLAAGTRVLGLTCVVMGPGGENAPE